MGRQLGSPSVPRVLVYMCMYIFPFHIGDNVWAVIESVPDVYVLNNFNRRRSIYKPNQRWTLNIPTNHQTNRKLEIHKNNVKTAHNSIQAKQMRTKYEHEKLHFGFLSYKINDSGPISHLEPFTGT